jgi:hypothetical protein
VKTGSSDQLEFDLAEPRPGSLIESLRSVGYTLPTAIADVIDNSITAQARNISVKFHWDGMNSHISVSDDGAGMTDAELREAMRPGSCNPWETRASTDLGRFGLGLKTASFSQCRRLSVLTRRSGEPVAARTWDLDHVVRHNEWRLLRGAEGADEYMSSLEALPQGTVVLWSNLDRITSGTRASDADAQDHFLKAVEHVAQHLGLVFHRFIEESSIRITMNGIRIPPWNPFLESHASTWHSPEEVIPVHSSSVVFRGFVLPHRDKLSEEEARAAAGPYGWIAHQGFFVYRSRRLLVPGDWLRLGHPHPWAKQEHYNLARIRLDLPNDMDDHWHIDVKKSTARPPVSIRERLTLLAENVRDRARSVFAHRGSYGPRSPSVAEFIRPWEIRERGGRRIYRVSREHPAVQAVIAALGGERPALDTLLRLLEETVPVQQIWLDMAEMPREPSPPYDGVDFSVIREDLRVLFGALVGAGLAPGMAVARLRTLEPFNRFPELVEELKNG